jgi:hypothetical protein
MGDLVRLTDPKALRPFVLQITGPLIRIIGDRFPWNVKVSCMAVRFMPQPNPYVLSL